MVCINCILLPALLFLWHKFVHPIIMSFWSANKPIKENPSNSTSKNEENENNINKCLSNKDEELSQGAKLIKDSKID